MKALLKWCRGEGKHKPHKTSLKQKVCYGVGHVFNDLCIQAWFSYLLIYFTKVVKLSPVNAGYIFLVSQIADAISTPFIGYACDKQFSRRVGERYGNKKIWHLFGSAGIALVWPFLYSPCLVCEEGDQEWKVVLYYGLLTALFSFFWPMVEISHLSLMPHVAKRAVDALELGAIRSALKLGCGVYIYIVTWILLGQNDETTIDESVQTPFTYQTIIVIITGGFFAIIFHWGVDEVSKHKPIKANLPALEEQQALQTSDREKQDLEVELNHIEIIEHKKTIEKPKTIKQWFKSPDFYIMMVVYMVTQNVLNLVQSYFPMYLTETLQFHKEAIAYFPLIILISGIFSSMSVKRINKKFSNRVLYCFGCVLVICSAAWFFFNPRDTRNAIYAPTIIMGSGASFMVVTSLAMVSDLIGDDKHSSGFVYAVMAFVDKLSLGLIVLGLQEYYPQGNESECLECGEYLRTAFAVFPGIEALIGFVCVAFLFQRTPFKNLRKQPDHKDDKKLELEEHDETYFHKLQSLRSTDV